MSISYFTQASANSPPVSSPTSTACSSNLYDIPVTQPACAMPYGGNHTSIMASCCHSAQVVSYYQNCGLYCLAEGQTVTDLTDCLFQNGAAWQDVFCGGNDTAEASGAANSVPTNAQASVVATGGGGTPTSGGSDLVPDSSSPAMSTSSQGAAAVEHRFSKLGFLLGILMQVPFWIV